MIPSPKKASIRSRTGLTLILVTVFLSLFIAGGLTALVIGLTYPGLVPWMVIGMFTGLPLLVLLGLWWGHYRIWINGDRVEAKGLFRNEVFFLSRTTGYALTHTPVKGGGEMENLHIGLPDGRIFSLNPQYYRNYADLRDTLVHGKLPDPKVLARAIKYQKWQQFVTFGFILGLGALMFFLTVGLPNVHVDPDLKGWHVWLSFGGGLLFVLWKYYEYARAPKE